MPESYVISEIKNEIATVIFYHPAHNSLPGNLLAKLANEITIAGENNAVKVVVLKSDGDRTFCAGASFQELIHIENKTEGEQFFSGFANVINAMRKCPKFIIARVQGKAVGGGVGLAAAADYCLASKYAAIKLSELNLGIGPFVIGPAVERKIGVSNMSQVTINASEFYPADWAKQKGLFADVLETTDQLDQVVSELASKLCGYSPDAVKHTKQMFWQGTENWDDLLQQRAKISGELVLSEFTKQKLERFKDK